MTRRTRALRASHWSLFASLLTAAWTFLGCAMRSGAPMRDEPASPGGESPASAANPEPLAIEEEFATSPLGRRLRYLRAGDTARPRVVYIHGTPGAGADFVDYLRYPVEGLEAISVDRLGFGGSEAKRSWPSLRDQAEAIEPLLVERDGQWPILVGHSLGGAVVCRVAADYPDRVGGIVVAAGSVDPDLEEIVFIQRIGALWGIRWLIPRALRHCNEELFALEAELRELEPLLASIRCPVAIVHGTKDKLVPIENVAYLRERLPRGAIVHEEILEGANHFLPWNNAPAMRRAVRSLRGGAAGGEPSKATPRGD